MIEITGLQLPLSKTKRKLGIHIIDKTILMYLSAGFAVLFFLL
jgi:hypothetical protein